MCLFMKYNRANERCFADDNIKKYFQRILYILLVLTLPIIFSALIVVSKNPSNWKGHRPSVTIMICLVQIIFSLIIALTVYGGLKFVNNFGKQRPDWLICYFNLFALCTLVLGASVYVAGKSLSFLSSPGDSDKCETYYK